MMQKHPSNILINVTYRSIVDGIASGDSTVAEGTLDEKMRNYLLRLGYSSAHITGIIVQLMTKGKVRVDFRDYTERLELRCQKDMMGSSEAMNMLENFVAEISTPEDSQSTNSGTTQRINVQLPKAPHNV